MLLCSFYHLFKVKAYNLDTALSLFSLGFIVGKQTEQKEMLLADHPQSTLTHHFFKNILGNGQVI